MSDRAYQRWRKKAERFAKRNGFFWLPCDLCGRYHGGHETSGSLPTGPNTSRGICAECTALRQEAAEARLRELGETTKTWASVSSWSGEHASQTIPMVLPK